MMCTAASPACGDTNKHRLIQVLETVGDEFVAEVRPIVRGGDMESVQICGAGLR